MEIDKIVHEIIINAFKIAKENSHEFVTIEHIILAALNEEIFEDAILKSGGDILKLKDELGNYLEENISKVDDEPEESLLLKTLFLYASRQAVSSGREVVELSHLISTLYGLEDCYAAYFMQEAGIEKSEILFNLTHGVNTEKSAEKKESFVEKYTEELTKISETDDSLRLIGREDIINRTVQILCRKQKNNPIHVGEPGVGKTKIVLGLCKLIKSGKVPSRLDGARVFSLDVGSLLAGTKYRGDFEERLKGLLEEIKMIENPIVYIDEIHNIVGAGALSAGSLDASNLIKPYLASGKIKFIGATTFDEYKKFFEKDKGLTRRFQKIVVEEPSVDESIKILNGIKVDYENYHGITYSKKAVEAAVKLSHKYINDKFLPDKAIDLLDEAGSLFIMEKRKSNKITERDIEDVISKICHIPKTKVETEEGSKLKDLEGKLRKRVFGQDKAIDEIVRAIKISRAGLNEENKPIASLLFVGPTGVGKTEIAKALSTELGVELVRFDMSEYSEKHAASKLIGSPPGYVGYDEGGLLTDSIRKKPNCILLLDEIEKANEDILNVLLGVMDYATLTDNKGRKADFRNVIIIMTSNAGAKNIGKALVGFGEREIKGDAIMDEVKRFFTPEFRNRLNKVVVFNHIDKDMAYNITNSKLEQFGEKLKTKGIILSYSNECVDKIVSLGISRQYGAREIVRVIDSEIKPLLIDEMLFGKLKNGGKVELIIENDKFKFNI